MLVPAWSAVLSSQMVVGLPLLLTILFSALRRLNVRSPEKVVVGKRHECSLKAFEAKSRY